MVSFVHRLASGVRVGWASSTAFASLGTTLTTLLLIPLLDVLFDVLMGHDLSSPNLVRTGYAAALVAVAVSVSGGVVSSVAADRNLGVFHEVHTRRRVDAAYWLSAGVMPLILAIPTGAAAIGSVFVLSSAHDIAMLGRVVALVPVVVVCGLLMGVGGAGVGVDLPDPYLGATVIASVLPLLAGVIVPLSDCPQWLRAAASLMPLSGVVGVIDTTGGIRPAIGHDLGVALAWALAGLLATRHAVVRVRAGLRRDVI
ncbi:hypothetical protein [Actinomyces gerencseriae]|uniref:hypothetical protein n=1 Tax=Actinomyces gerencseriae TaxID=52769 RepID=UPI00041BE576|nr:hypothetical protein [Actinomyces gerencseriae]